MMGYFSFNYKLFFNSANFGLKFLKLSVEKCESHIKNRL